MEQNEYKPQAAEAPVKEEKIEELNPSPVEPVAEEENELSALKKELEKVQEENKKLYDQYLRALAETENSRKRAAKDKEEYLKFAVLPLIKKILPS